MTGGGATRAVGSRGDGRRGYRGRDGRRGWAVRGDGRRGYKGRGEVG